MCHPKTIGKVSDTLDTYWMPQCPLVWENIFSISPICMNDVIFSKGRHVTDGGAGNLSYYIPLCNHISPQFRPTWLALQSNLISICFHPNFPFIMIQTYCNQINGRQVQRGRVYLFYHTFEVFFGGWSPFPTKTIFYAIHLRKCTKGQVASRYHCDQKSKVSRIALGVLQQCVFWQLSLVPCL